MTNSIFSDLFNEAEGAASPQLPELASKQPAMSLSPLALIRSLADQLETSRARAAEAERQLATHHRHCICRAGEIATEEAEAKMIAADIPSSSTEDGSAPSLAT
ncbi:hypothetical protein GCM10007908_24350 [Rhizobium albus]|nr:hypothetical protein GCM10007908_24350 [Rhizobium albus]